MTTKGVEKLSASDRAKQCRDRAEEYEKRLKEVKAWTDINWTSIPQSVRLTISRGEMVYEDSIKTDLELSRRFEELAAREEKSSPVL